MSNPASVIAFGSAIMKKPNPVSEPSETRKLPLTFELLATIIGAFTLIAGLIISFGLALIYLSASLLHLGSVGMTIDSLIVGLPCLYGCYRLLLHIIAVERDPDLHRHSG